MANKKNKSAFKYSEAINSDKIIFALLILILVVIPILIRVVITHYSSPLIGSTSFNSGNKMELATYYKFTGLITGTVILVAALLYKIIREGYQIPVNYTTIPLAVMFIIILASGLFARYKTISMFGQFNLHEGTLTYLSYLFLFLMAGCISYQGKRARWLYYALYPLILINVFLMVSFFYGYDVTQNFLLNKLLIPASVTDPITVRSTLFNPNFLSGFSSVVTTLFLSLAVLVKDEKAKALHLVFALLSFTMMLAATSTSGFVTVLALQPFIVLLIFLSKRIKEGIITLLVAWLIFGGAFVVLNSHNPTVYDESIGFFISRHANPNKGTQNPPAKKTETKSQTSSDKDFGLPPRGVSAGNGRVYIWKKTGELILKRPILGYGLETLTYYFPQDDPGKNTGLGVNNAVVDEPHNLYLNIAYGSGVFALLAFLVLVGSHFWFNIKLLRKPLDSERRIILASLFGGWCAFLVQGLFNNSILGTMPVFWILFGASVSMIIEEVES